MGRGGWRWDKNITLALYEEVVQFFVLGPVSSSRNLFVPNCAGKITILVSSTM